MFHFRDPIQDWPRAVRNLPDRYVVKAVDNVQMLAEVKGACNPKIKTILRHYYQQQVPGYSLEDNMQRARDYFNSFIDGTFLDGSTHGWNHAAATDYIEGWNEYFGNGMPADERSRFISWAQAAAQVWATEYRTNPKLAHVKLILANTAVGNDIPMEVARAAQRWDALLGYHPYWPIRDNQSPDDLAWRWYDGRWIEMDALYRAHGITVNWALTEAGAIGYHGDWPFIGLNPDDGWRMASVHGADIERFKESITTFMNRWASWNTSHGHRALAPVLFDSAFNGWQMFQIHQPNLDAIAALAHSWHPGENTTVPLPPPPDPPPPDPGPEPPGDGECRGAPREQYARVFNVIKQSESEERAVEIFRSSWREGKQTVGGSWDDAGIGDLDNRTAVLWNLTPAEMGVAEDWFGQFYPGVNVEFARGLALASPVSGIALHVTDPFGSPRPEYPEFTNKKHEGIDLRAVKFVNGEARPVAILAPAAGVVSWASDLKRGTDEPSKYGKHIVIDLYGGYTVILAHLSEMYVVPGEAVLAREAIGLAGSSGQSTGVHLHLTVIQYGGGLSGYVVPNVVDPTPLLGL